MTADEFSEMPDDGLLHELIRGEVVTMSLTEKQNLDGGDVLPGFVCGVALRFS
jgi:hypothetical protein